jgi:hypothetical protein
MTVKTTQNEEDSQIVQEFAPEKIKHHEYRQIGDYVVCQSCVHTHAEQIKPGYVLTKDKEGDFVLVTYEEDARMRQL